MRPFNLIHMSKVKQPGAHEVTVICYGLRQLGSFEAARLRSPRSITRSTRKPACFCALRLRSSLLVSGR
jgi:hypothetical protein